MGSNIYDRIEMVKLPNECWITFEHPVLVQCGMHSIDDNNMMEILYDDLDRLDSDEIEKYGLEWKLPKHLFTVHTRYQDRIYNFVLDSHHSLNVNGNWCCTLGHDYMGDVIEHEFWGNSKAILSHLKESSDAYPNVMFN